MRSAISVVKNIVASLPRRAQRARRDRRGCEFGSSPERISIYTAMTRPLTERVCLLVRMSSGTRRCQMSDRPEGSPYGENPFRQKGLAVGAACLPAGQDFATLSALDHPKSATNSSGVRRLMLRRRFVAMRCRINESKSGGRPNVSHDRMIATAACCVV